MIERKNSLKQLHRRMFAMYGHAMTPEAKAINESSWELSEQMYDRDIEKYHKLAMKEMEDEMVERIMKRVSVEVQDNASKPLQDLDKQIKQLFSR